MTMDVVPLSSATLQQLSVPHGFLTLGQAVDTIGERIFGPSWRAEPGDAAHVTAWRYETVINKIAEACEAEKVGAAYHCVFAGAAALDRTEWRKSNWREYFRTGMIYLHLPVLRGGRPTGELTPWLCERPVYIQRDDLEQFAKTLPRPPRGEQPPPMAKADVERLASEYLKHRGRQATQDEFIKRLQAAGRPFDRLFAREIFKELAGPLARGRKRTSDNLPK